MLLALLASGCSSGPVDQSRRASPSEDTDEDTDADDTDTDTDNPKGSAKDGGKIRKDAGKDASKDAGDGARDSAVIDEPEDDSGGSVSSNDEGAEFTRKACEVIRGADGDTGRLSLDVQVVAQGLEIPWGLAWLPDGDMLVTERPGRLRRISGGQLQSTPVLEVKVAQLSLAEEGIGLGSEGGLLGVLVHPDYENNHLIYLYYSTRNSRNGLINRLVAYELSDDGSITEEGVLLDDIPGGVHHQGGRMAIGPDGKLYVGVGAYDPSLAQKPDQLPGKLLRMNLDGTIPDDNPDPDSFVFLTGVRNTQGYDWFDDKHLLLMDHGPTAVDPGVPQKGWDEFDVARAGENFGWPNRLGCDKGSNVVQPVMTWQRSLPPGGAAIYRGTSIKEWDGSFIVGVLGLPGMGEGEQLHRIQVSPDNPYVVEKHEVYLKGQYGRLRTVAMGPDGHLYITTSNCDPRGLVNGQCANGGDKVLRIVGTK